jgi:hypothetical protein
MPPTRVHCPLAPGSPPLPERGVAFRPAAAPPAHARTRRHARQAHAPHVATAASSADTPRAVEWSPRQPSAAGGRGSSPLLTSRPHAADRPIVSDPHNEGLGWP